MYEYAAGDIRGNTRELVRATSPEHARKLCVALGVPAEYVQTWAVQNHRDEYRDTLHAAERASAREIERANEARDRAEERAEEAEQSAANANSDLNALRQRVERLQRGIDDVYALLLKINTDAELDAGDADTINRARDALGAL